jgi:putative peptidoglycan lipid II flippase
MSQMLKSSSAMAAATLASRVLGLVREQVYARFMGDGPVASAFKLAFQIPNLFRRLLGEGALSAAFIPLFKQKEAAEGDAAMWRAANATLSALVIVTALLVGAGLIGISLLLALVDLPWIRNGQAVFPPWFLSDDTRLMLRLLRVMLPYLVLVNLAALCIGMLNARGHFFVPALGATLLNVVMIASVLFLTPWFGTDLETQVFALGVGVLLAGVAQFCFQLPTLFREGFRFRWVTPWQDPTVREVGRRMVPGIVGVAAFQLNVTLIMLVSYWVDEHIVASFDYAVRLMEFPQGLVGVSLASYLLPTLSGLAAEKRFPEFRATLDQGLGYVAVANLLASVLLVVLAEPIVRLLFQGGRFDVASTQRTALALTCLAPGLVAFSGVNLFARAFYALGDTQTPMRVSVFCVVLNLMLSLWLVGPFQQAGLGLANTLTSALNLGLLSRALRKKLKTLDFSGLRVKLLCLLPATLAAGVVAWAVRGWWQQQWGHASLAQRLGEVFVPALAAAALYFGLAAWLKVAEAREILSLLARKLPGRRRG